MQVSGVNFYNNKSNFTQTNFQSKGNKSYKATIRDLKNELKNVKERQAAVESNKKETINTSRNVHMRPAPDGGLVSDKDMLQLYLKRCKRCRELGLEIPHPLV